MALLSKFNLLISKKKKNKQTIVNISIYIINIATGTGTNVYLYIQSRTIQVYFWGGGKRNELSNSKYEPSNMKVFGNVITVFGHFMIFLLYVENNMIKILYPKMVPMYIK